MSYLYVNEQGASVGTKDNRVEVKYKDGMVKSIPIETLETIQVFGNVQITTQCLAACLKKGIDVIYYSTNGRYFGRLISPSHVNTERQRRQAELTASQDFCLPIAKRIIDAKIRNQIVILCRYARNREADICSEVNQMQQARKHISSCTDVAQLMGYEGTAAHSYFQGLGRLIEPAFHFDKRTKRPPRDAFNSLISLGYSIILNEIYGKIEARGLNPYFGVMHSDKEKHPTLASDLMEEWRAVIVDTVAMSLINGHEILMDEFYHDDEGGVFLKPEGFRKFVRKLENKMNTRNRYLGEEEGELTFRRAMDVQVMKLCHALEEKDNTLYHPLIIR